MKKIWLFVLLFPIDVQSETFKEWLNKDKHCHPKKCNFHNFWEQIEERRKERMKQKKKMEQVLNVFETGSKDPDYCNITIYNDGPNDRRQITYGRTQVTEFGNLKAVVKNYVERDGLFSSALEGYVDKIGKGSLCENQNFIDLLKMSGKDPVMMQCQDEVFEEKYWGPAKKWWKDNGFKEELSMLVIYDSFVHSGSIHSFLRNKFAEKVPAQGGDEKKWITEYVNARHEWLATHRRSILRKTIYRTNVFKNLISQGNWDLGKQFSAQGFTFLGDIIDNLAKNTPQK